ncbi:MAG: hypothetical protein U5P10_07190 [Spirochaetia bacterium]|nr:hypothetical protein [Spirochaetia bacterium]
MRFLLLSPQLEVHFADGVAEAEDAPTEQAEALKSAASERSVTGSIRPAQ